jgi:hypothetical protein
VLMLVTQILLSLSIAIPVGPMPPGNATLPT